MQVRFRSTNLQQAYEQSGTAAQLYGQAVGRKYIMRIDALLAAKDWSQVRAARYLRAHPLKGARQGQWALDLTGRMRLIVLPSVNGEEVEVREVSKHYD